MARAKLGEILIQQGVIDASALKLALGAQIRFASQGMKIGQVLVDMGACTAEHVARALGTQMGVPYTDLTTAQPLALAMIPIDLAARHHAIAIAYEAGPPEVVHVAFAEPLDLTAVDAARSVLRKRVKAFIASPEAIAAKLASLGAASLEPVAGAGERSELGDVLFSDEGGGTLAIEHEEPGQMRVPGAISMGDERSVDIGLGDDLFTRATTPLPAAEPIRAPTPLPAPSGAADFDSLFGPGPSPAPAMPRGSTPVPLDGLPLLEGSGQPELEGAVLEGTVSPLLEGIDPAAMEDEGPPPPPVPIHYFADTRPPKPPKPKPAPKPAPGELSSEDLFGEEASLEPETASAPLMGAEFAPEAVPEAPPVELAHGLFGAASAHVGEHSDEFPAPQEAERRDRLFGNPHEHLSEHVSGEGLEAAVETPVVEAPVVEEAPALALPVTEAPAEWSTPVSEAHPEPSSAPAPVDEAIDLDFAEADSIPDEPIAEIPSPPLSAPVAPPVPALAPVVSSPKVAPAPPDAAPAVVSAPKLPAAPPAPLPVPALVSAPKLPAAPPAAWAPASEPVPASGLSSEPPPVVVSTPKLPTSPPAVAVPSLVSEPEPPALPAAEAAPEAAAEPSSAVSFALSAPAHPEPGAAALPDSLASFADRPLTEAEIEVISAIELLADGALEEAQVKPVKPAQMIAALVRLLIRQGVIQETDFLEELSRK